MFPVNTKSSDLPPASLWLGHWILLAASCNIAGWTLSAIQFLTPLGLAIAIPCIWTILARLSGVSLPRFSKPGFLRHIRGCRLLPLSFLLIALLALLGGLLHPPNNYDALNYRMPRLSHWLMAQRWEWISANFNNLNTRSTGFEWLTAPLIALLRSDRPVFLINFVSFLFMPGLVFGVFRQMGVSRRAAFAWMWLLPSGYCFALQAGSIGNDLPAATFALAAFDFGFRWRKSGSWQCFALALAAAGLMTAIKPTTLTLLLPFAVLFFGMWKPFVYRPFHAIALASAFALASFLPNAVINHRQCGDWTGAAAEDAALGTVKPIPGLVVNLINAPIQNLAPPIFPLAKHWNAWFPTLFPQTFLDSLTISFEARAARFGLTDIQGEEAAGIGTGISVVWLGSFVAALILRKRYQSRKLEARPDVTPAGILALLFGSALLIYFAKTGMNTVARHIAPFYPFLIAVTLTSPVHGIIVRSKLWNRAALAAVASTVAMMILTPSRPLWPAQQVFSALSASFSSPTLTRAIDGYSVYSERSDALGVLRDALPPDTRTVGLLSFAPGPEQPLWKPYLQRQVHHIRPTESLEPLIRNGLHYVVLNTSNFENRMGVTPDQWLAQNHASILKRQSIRMLAKEPASEWWLVELPGEALRREHGDASEKH